MKIFLSIAYDSWEKLEHGIGSTGHRHLTQPRIASSHFRQKKTFLDEFHLHRAFRLCWSVLFFAEHLIFQVADNEALTMEWIPDELRPVPQPTLRPDGEYLERVWGDSVYPMAERLGLSIKVPNISPQPHTGLAFGLVLESRKYREHHLQAFRHAQDERNITAVSTFVKGNDKFQGLPSLLQLR